MDKIKRLVYKISHPIIRFYWRTFKPRTFGSRGIILNNGRVLLTKNINVSHWSLPGGKIDRGENPLQCLFRELKEELGLDVNRVDYKLGEYTSQQEGKRDIVYIYVITVDSNKFEKQWELEDAQWFPLSTLPGQTSPATKRRLNELKLGKRELILDW